MALWVWAKIKNRQIFQIGRRIISTDGGGAADQSEVIDLDSRIIGGGDNALFGFGATKQDFSFQEGRGLAAAPAISTGRAAQGDLTEVFRLTSSNNENRFNVSGQRDRRDHRHPSGETMWEPHWRPLWRKGSIRSPPP
jgi:hypothetical protein